MIVEQAHVLHYHNGIAKIQCFAKAGCGSCAAKGCGTKALSALVGEKIAPQFELAVDTPLQKGDRIEIGLPEHRLLQSVLWLYALPLAVLILSTLLFSACFEEELWVATAVFSSVSATFFYIKKRMTRHQLADLKPVFVRKLEGETNGKNMV